MSPPQVPRPRRRLVIASFVLAVLYCAFFTVAGWKSPFVAEIRRDFGFSPSWCASFLSFFRLVWTIPIGVIIAFLLLRKDSHFAPQMSQRVNITSVILLVVFVSIWSYAVFSGMFTLMEGQLISAPRH